ncbi:MAG: hypothetical protein ACTHLD_10690 [Chitinophaga sp.]
MKWLIGCCFLLAGTPALQAQTPNRSSPRDFVWQYIVPDNIKSGPRDVHVTGTYYFTRESIGKKYVVYVHCKITSSEFMPRGGSRRYLYNGRIYGEADLSGVYGEKSHEFDQLRITSVDIRITANSVENAKMAAIGDNIASEVGQVDKDTDLDHLSLNLVSSKLVDLNWQGSAAIEARINAMAKARKNKEDYQQAISGANAAFNAKKWSEARSLYGKAARLQENEQYPKDQIAKIDKILADEKPGKPNKRKIPRRPVTAPAAARSPLPVLITKPPADHHPPRINTGAPAQKIIRPLPPRARRPWKDRPSPRIKRAIIT